MNNHRPNLQIAMQLCLVALLTVFIAASVHAQTPAAAMTTETTRNTRAGLCASTEVSLVPVRFRLTAATSARTNAGPRPTTINLMPIAGPNPQVLGGGTLGRLTKWTGFTSSNSVIGDTTIFEDKFGNVGIGTDSPTSKLTVAGTIQASGGSSILRTPTLTGNGTLASPLGVAVPLFLTGAVNRDAVIEAINTDQGSTGIVGHGGNLTTNLGPDTGGVGVQGIGGNGLPTMFFGGAGVVGRGGDSGGIGGPGVDAIGGASGADIRPGGAGIRALGGTNTNFRGGEGVFARGGTGGNGGPGPGVIAAGGDGDFGASGIEASAGRGSTPDRDGVAGIFNGDVTVVQDLDVEGHITARQGLTVIGTKLFKIDHPLDPRNKYLMHAAIESSEVLNVYSGNVVTDSNGDAVVDLPDWFEALNRDYRYQLTTVGTFAQAIVADEIKNNRFRIQTSAPSVKVSWQVTGVRSDPQMRRHPFTAEENKPERERGYYLSPDAYDQPEERGIQWARRPELMQRVKEANAKTEKQRK